MKRLVLLWIVACLPLHAKFSDEAWKKIQPVYDAIRVHPFNVELEKGTLSSEKYQFYLAQDSLYLTDYARALGVLGSKLDAIPDIKKVLADAMDCLIDEKKPLDKPVTQTPSAFAYVNFLLATAAFKSREELAAALLPCYWIYLKVAEAMKPSLTPKHPYREWIERYASEKYKKTVEEMIAITDRLAASVSKEEQQKMQTAFLMGARYELAFWEASYSGEVWKP